MEKTLLLNKIIANTFLKDLQNLEYKINNDSNDLNNIQLTLNSLNSNIFIIKIH